MTDRDAELARLREIARRHRIGLRTALERIRELVKRADE